MPVSEDELDSRIHSSVSQNNEYHYSTMSKAEQRKNNKPIMEKRRRARINQCLNELKALILDATNKDPARHTKLEKADILEMTVKHLQSIQRQRFTTAVVSDPSVVRKFKTGFNECASEVSKYIGSLDGVDVGVRKRLIEHLSNCVTGMQTPPPLPSIPNPFTSAELRLTNSEDPNNNDPSRFQMSGLQLIPSRLPSGELALLLPNSSSLSSLFPRNHDLTNHPHTSAFTPISKDLKVPSPTEESVNSHSEVSSTSNDGTSFGKYDLSSSLLMQVNATKPNHKQTGTFKPLTVYTDSVYENYSPIQKSPPTSTKSPLDFSVKKESEESPSSTNTFVRKRPLADLPCNIRLPTKSAKLHLEPECHSLRNDVHQSGPAEITGGRDMWRPW